MMKKTIIYLLTAVMLASIPSMDLMASRASHGDWYFREEWGGTQYSAYVAGNGKVHYKVLIYATGSSRNFWAYSDENNITQGSRCWTQLQGSADQPVFLIYEADNKGHNRPIGDDCDGCNPNDRGWVKLKVLSDAIIVTNTYDGVPVHVAPDGQWHEFYLKRMSTADWLTYLEFDYIEPAAYANQTYFVGNSVCYRREGGEISDQARGEQTRVLAEVEGGNPDQAPQLQNPFLYVVNENGTTGFGKIGVLYFSVQKPYRYWINGTGDPIACDQNADMLYLNSDDVVRSLYITMEVQRSMDTTQSIILKSNTINIPAYHKIHDFAIRGYRYQENSNQTFSNDRYKEISWKIYYPWEEDIIDGDMFEIQRAYHSDFSDAQTIGVVPMEYDSTKLDSVANVEVQTYTYVDSVPEAWWNPVDNNRYQLYYRIRRASSAQWGWIGHDFTASLTHYPQNEFSPFIYTNSLTYSLADDFETSHQVNFSLGLPNKNMNPERSAEKPGFSYYYLDPKQRFILRRILSELQDTVEIVIPTDSVQKAIDEVRFNTNDSIYSRGAITIRYTDVASTPCVHYKYEVYIDTTGVTVSRPDKDYPAHRPVKPASSKDQNVYFTEAANINIFSATKLTYSDGVLLTWELTDGNVGYYTIETRPAGKDTAWTLVVDSLTTGWYKDITANPYVSPEWEYRLTMTYECNGNTKSVSDSVVGSRNPYGKVSGYVRYEDGTACPGIKVVGSRTSDGEIVQTVVTDENGYYLLDSLLYGEGYPYAITPTSTKAQFTYNNTSANNASVTLGLDDCIKENINFANISSVRMTGRVLYENSTVPARDVNFKLNGIPVMNGSALYKTDALGNFELRVPENDRFTLQAFKEGHTFLNNGFVKMDDESADSTLLLVKALDDVRITDLTKVRLIGRIAGGRIQAEKPLGFGLSTNNIGDDLQMVFELEGDNISHIVSIPEDKTIDYIDTIVRHDVHDGELLDSVGATFVEYQKKRIIIRPDVTTGEYEVDMFPVKYKITQANAKGYATLFAEGKTSETLDLTNAPLQKRTNTEGGKSVDYNETYSITYHSPISVSCTQLRYGMEVGYYGEETINRKNIHNKNINVPIAQKQADGSYTYLFGAPVFKSDTYQFRVTAHEDYYYNNEPTSPQHEEVRLHGGTLKVYNGMYDATNTEIQTKELDANGQVEITVPVNYVSFLKTGESALRVLDLSVEYEGAYVESQAIKAFVTGDKAKGQEFTASTHGKVVLLDILRDPPGSGSSAFIESGTTYKYSYNLNLAFTFGINVEIGYGTSASYTMGTWAGVGGGAFVGMQTDINTVKTVGLPIEGKYVYKHNAVYTFTTTERIETGSDPMSVGPSADVYIGATQNVYYGLMDAVQPLDSLTYVTLAARSANGTMRAIAEGTDADGQKYYLVIGTELGAESYIDATFIYTQDYIENTLLEQLKQRRDALLMTGDSATVAAIAQVTHKPVYWSKVTPDDENFAQEGHYVMIRPDDDRVYDDEVASYNRQIYDWFRLMVDNETEKINALRGTKGKLVGTWSLGGTTKINHSESYEYSNAYTSQVFWPGSSGNLPGADMVAIFKYFGKTVGDKLTKAYNQLVSGTNEDGDPTYASPLDLKGKTPGASWTLKFTPILNFDMALDPSSGDSHKRSTGFTLKADDLAYGHLDVSVYRVEDKRSGFNDDPDDTMDETDANDDYVYGSYVYYLNGGATRCPWEGPDSTRFYTPKVPLSAGTLKLENPKLDIDVHERSNVPVDQAAVFTLRLTNEGEVGYGTGNYAIPFTLKLAEGTNPKGARIVIDGVPLLEEGRVIRLTRGEIITKLVQVYAGEGYDFENISLSLVSPCMVNTKGQCTFSVHYMPVACPVSISAPHDKWIMNTLSPQDSAGWYLPVVIDGFDVNYRNFDHIEFQYKLTTQSDEAWVNLCSYYANDSLYERASGTKAMISGGRIENIRFYGERDPMEQQYDLRAVAFCRHGNGFITRPSAVMRGIKDTRVPRVFGKPNPTNSILTGDNQILLRFNEPIAGNYLDKDNNFQVTGYTNTTGLLASTSVFFAEAESSYASSPIMRNLSAKSFTIDLMIKPAEDGSSAVLFEHGDEGLKFGIKEGTTLYLQFGDKVISSKPVSKVISGFTRVAAVYNYESQKVLFYIGTENVSLDLNGSDAPQYNVKAPLIFGRGFRGNMLEARIWTKALTQEEISDTYMVQMTGYERKLADYYPMNEGKGHILADKANGAYLLLHNGSWTTPDGISLAFDGTQEGIRLKDELLSRSAAKDMTLMFWFRAESLQGDTVALLTAGNQDATTGEALGTFIGFRNGELYYSNDLFEHRLAGSYIDGSWHSFVLTVNRTYNATAIYMDGSLISSILSDEIGAFSGTMYLGSKGLIGNIDNLVLFEQALPQNLIEQYDNISPSGDEMGLMALLTFSDDQENSSGIIRKVFSPNDQRVFKTSEGVVVEGKVQPLIDSAYIEQAKAQADYLNLPPAREKATLSKMNFDWAYNNDELMINLNMFDYEINKQNIQITVREVEDLNGNPMENPVTWSVFVNKNRLKWAEKNIEYILDRDEYSEDVFTFKTKIVNTSGERYQFTIDGLPAWLACSEVSGTLEPEEERTLTFTVDAPNMNVGDYSELIYLTDMNDLSEPLLVDISIEAQDPWQNADFSEYPTTMNIRAQVYVDEKIDTDADDIVAAFVNNECVGKVNIDVDEALNEAFVYLTIHGSDSLTGEKVAFRLWQASTGKILPLIPSAAISYKANTTKGYSPQEPVLLSTSSKEMMNIQLSKGWNWVSLYKIPASMAIDDVLPSYVSWNRHDQVKSTVALSFSEYNRASDDTSHYEWYGTMDTWSWQYMYMLYCHEDVTDWYLIGDEPTMQQRTISLRNGWNSVPYMMNSTRTITDAFADYYDNASVGDVIKNRTAIAVFTESGKWKGSLQTLKPGEGYLFYRVGKGTVNMVYPENKPLPVEAKAEKKMAAHPYATNMVVFATAEVMPVAHANGIDYTPTEIEDGQYLFLIGGEDAAEVTFTLDGESAEQTVGYEPNKIVGTIQQPLELTVRKASDRAEKILINDHVFIRRDGKTYSIIGQEINK